VSDSRGFPAHSAEQQTPILSVEEVPPDRSTPYGHGPSVSLGCRSPIKLRMEAAVRPTYNRPYPLGSQLTAPPRGYSIPACSRGHRRQNRRRGAARSSLPHNNNSARPSIRSQAPQFPGRMGEDCIAGQEILPAVRRNRSQRAAGHGPGRAIRPSTVRLRATAAPSAPPSLRGLRSHRRGRPR
jgi:hypothetical protein